MCAVQRAQEFEKQLTNLKQDVAAEEQDLEELVVGSPSPPLVTSGVSEFVCVFSHVSIHKTNGVQSFDGQALSKAHSTYG